MLRSGGETSCLTSWLTSAPPGLLSCGMAQLGTTSLAWAASVDPARGRDKRVFDPEVDCWLLPLSLVLAVATRPTSASRARVKRSLRRVTPNLTLSMLFLLLIVGVRLTRGRQRQYKCA